MRNLAVKQITGGISSGFAAAGQASIQKAVPFDCELLGVVMNLSAVPTAPHSAGILINNIEIATPVDIQFLATVQSGFFTPGTRVFMDQGDRVRLQSNGENSGTDAYTITISYILRPLSSGHEDEIWMDGETIPDIAAATTTSSLECVGFDCLVRGVAVSISAATNADLTLKLELDDRVTNAFLTIPSGTTTGYFLFNEAVHAKTGAMVLLRTTGEGTTGGQAFFNYALRPESNSVPVGWEYMGFRGGYAFQNPDTLQSIVAPCAGKLRNLVTHWREPIATSPTTGQTFTIEVNGSSPPGTPIYRNVEHPHSEAGFSVPIENTHDVFVVRGDLVTVVSGAEQVLATSNSTAGIWIEPMGQLGGEGH